MYINMDLLAGFVVGFMLCAVLLSAIAGWRQKGGE
jgi:hypothetical protein